LRESGTVALSQRNNNPEIAVSDGLLVIGTRRYSSWSLRGWLAVRLAGLDVTERLIPIAGGSTPEVARVTPAAMVPYLEHQGARVWESLAICEYCAEFAPSLWPADRVARAHARSIAAEMHAGFRALRQAMPMNLGRDKPVAVSPEAQADITRIEALWREARSGAFLCNDHFGAADAMFAPIVARFLSYRPTLAADSLAYCQAVRGHPLVAAWYDAAAQEPVEWRLARYEDLA
jgi:glutathione S-transferase